jgi:hypothetical protein
MQRSRLKMKISIAILTIAATIGAAHAVNAETGCTKTTVKDISAVTDGDCPPDGICLGPL